jgi:hypothetical protein
VLSRHKEKLQEILQPNSDSSPNLYVLMVEGIKTDSEGNYLNAGNGVLKGPLGLDVYNQKLMHIAYPGIPLEELLSSNHIKVLVLVTCALPSKKGPPKQVQSVIQW